MFERAVVRAPRSIDLTGKRVILRTNGSVFPFHFSDGIAVFVAVFSSSELLESAMETAGVLIYESALIFDSRAFVESVRAAGLRIALDPVKVPGRLMTRWTEVI